MSAAGYIINSGRAGLYAIALANGKGVFFANGSNHYAAFSACDGALRAVAAVYNVANNSVAAVYTNGVDASGTKRNESYSAGSGHLMVGDRAASRTYPFTGDVYAIRLYGTPLTPEQIATNAAIDAVRYFGATPTNLLRVTAAPYCIPVAVSPGYAGRPGLSAGDRVPVSAPQGRIDLSDDSYAVCTGWKLYDRTGAVVDLGCYEYVPGALECGVVPSAAVLVGDDEVTLAATVSGTETSGLTYSWLVVDQNGRVATNVADGAEAAISLSPGYGVYDVALTVRNAGGTEAAFSAARLFQIKAATVYVATDATPAFPYDTHATAFTNVVDAIDFAEDGMRVVITDGIYTNASNPTVAKNFTIESENGPAATTVYSVNATNPGWTLNAQGAVVRGLTLLSDNAGGQNQNRPSSIVVSAGTIDGCVATNWYSYYTPLLRVGTQGVVTNCAIVGCRTRYRCHFASVSGNGLLTGCRLVRNISDTASSAYGAIVIVNDDGSTLRNCLIADNTIASKPEHASVVYQAKGVVESCTLAGNAATGLATIPAVSIAAGTFRNNVVWGNSNTAGENGVSAVSAALVAYSCAPGLSGTGCIGDKDPRFKKASAGDYRLRSNSPCVDAGQNQAWMADAADLDGNARVNERRPAKMVDMGCYEYSRPAGSLLMSH